MEERRGPAQGPHRDAGLPGSLPRECWGDHTPPGVQGPHSGGPLGSPRHGCTEANRRTLSDEGASENTFGAL